MQTFSFARDSVSEFLLGVRGLNEIMSCNLSELGARRTDEFPKDKGKRAAPPPGLVMQLGLSQASLPPAAELCALHGRLELSLRPAGP